jgi:hypothetical protein
MCVGLVLGFFLWTFSVPQIDVDESSLPNPLFIPALAELFPFADLVIGVLMIAIMVIILPSLIARFRGSDQRVRQQLMWFGLVFAIITLSIIPMAFAGLIFSSEQETLSPIESLISSLFFAFITIAPFFAVAYTILRHRLYDIEIIIRRTLSYAVLTTILALIYFGGVVLAQQVFRATTGQTSGLAIVVSTLLIAALFNPLRRRIQDTIDRRFYRRKYDAEKTLANFGQSLRDEVDLDTMQASLVGVVHETMQPTSIAIWMPGKQPK